MTSHKIASSSYKERSQKQIRDQLKHTWIRLDSKLSCIKTYLVFPKLACWSNPLLGLASPLFLLILTSSVIIALARNTWLLWLDIVTVIVVVPQWLLQLIIGILSLIAGLFVRSCWSTIHALRVWGLFVFSVSKISLGNLRMLPSSKGWKCSRPSVITQSLLIHQKVIMLIEGFLHLGAGFRLPQGAAESLLRLLNLLLVGWVLVLGSGLLLLCVVCHNWLNISFCLGECKSIQVNLLCVNFVKEVCRDGVLKPMLLNQ